MRPREAKLLAATFAAAIVLAVTMNSGALVPFANAVCETPPVNLDLDASCMHTFTFDEIDNGSTPYPEVAGNFTIVPSSGSCPGDVGVTLTVNTTSPDSSDSCSTTVTLVDVSAPSVNCNAPDEIIPSDAPICFTATADDNCESCDGEPDVAILDFDCYAERGHFGRLVDKTESCVVSIDDDEICILDSGGVGTTIEWHAQATDGSGNQMTLLCDVDVVKKEK